ncbi:MAG: hypothetical protein ACO31E_00630 [Phycisphaerales bacterium]|jgi:hypothetical protein
MSPLGIFLVLAATFATAVAVGRVMSTRIDDARRLAELVRDTRRLRARHEHPMPASPPRSRRR